MRKTRALLTVCFLAAGQAAAGISGGPSAVRPEITKVEATGMAAIFAGNVDRARMAALREAYVKAVQKGCGAELGSLTRFENVKAVSTIISGRAPGFVTAYAIKDEGISKIDENKYEVVIEAEVFSSGEMGEESKEALGLYLELMGDPKILIILPEKKFNAPGEADKPADGEFSAGGTRFRVTRGNGDGAGESPGAAPQAGAIRSTEAALARSFAAYGYQVMTSDDLLTRNLVTPEVLAQAKAGVTARGMEVARAADADLALIGVIQVGQEKISPAGTEMTMVSAEASAKAMIVSSGKLIEAFHSTARASHPQALKAYSDCLDKVAEQITEALSWKIPEILSNEYRETKLTVSGVDKKQAMQLQDFLSKMSGIERVRLAQLPTEKNPLVKFVLMTGYISLEPYEVIEECSGAIKKPLNLIAANKYEIECMVEIAMSGLN
jgi:hypothetical protein